MAATATVAEAFYSRLTEIGAPRCALCRHHHFEGACIDLGFAPPPAEAETQWWSCVLCGASGDSSDGGYKAHELGEQHMRAGAALSLQTADMGWCPWCPPDPETKKLVRLSDCRDTSHAAELNDCREVVGA